MGSIIKHSFFVMAVSVLFFSCNDSKNDEIDMSEGPVDMPASLDSTKISAQNVFNSIPARAQIVSLVTDAKAEYDPSLLNNPDDVNKYSVESKKALNLGTYGADLSATGVYEQTQESMLYLKCVNILAKNLGVSSAFDEKMVDRMEANKENRDSTLEIISQSFKNADSFLKANGRPGTSSLIVAGAWIEALHIACNTARATRNENMIREVFNQAESLRHLIDLLDHSKVSEDAQYVIADLVKLRTAMEARPEQVFNTESLKNIASQTEALRKKVITTN